MALKAINFSVPTQLRQDQNGVPAIQSPVINYPGGYQTIQWTYDIPNTSDYENPANSLLAKLLVNGVDAQIPWQGGRQVNKLGVVDPPVNVEFDITNVPAGTTLQVTVSVPKPMTVGLSGSVSPNPT